MSMAALLLATRDRIRSVLGLDASHCEVTGLDGRPPGIAGQSWISVCWGSWEVIPCEGLGESFGVDIILTMRIGAVPSDRIGTDLDTVSGTGIEALARKVIAACHLDVGQDAILNGANARLGTGLNGFVTPLKFQSCDPRPTERGPEWFEGTPYDGGPYAPAAESFAIRLRGAERYQTIESMA